MTIHLSHPHLLAARAARCIGAFMPRRIAPVFALIGALVPLGYAVLMLFDFETGARACSTSPTTCGSPTSASTTSSASTG